MTTETPVLEEDDDCDHDDVVDEEREGGILYGMCNDCHQFVRMTGDEDEYGVPGWELAE